MKKLFVILAFLFCLVGCIKTNTNPVNNVSSKTYVYEIHTIGGICDTVVSNSKASRWVTDGNVIIMFDDIDYSYVDKFRLIEERDGNQGL